MDLYVRIDPVTVLPVGFPYHFGPLVETGRSDSEERGVPVTPGPPTRVTPPL